MQQNEQLNIFISRSRRNACNSFPISRPAAPRSALSERLLEKPRRLLEYSISSIFTFLARGARARKVLKSAQNLVSVRHTIYIWVWCVSGPGYRWFFNRFSKFFHRKMRNRGEFHFPCPPCAQMNILPPKVKFSDLRSLRVLKALETSKYLARARIPPLHARVSIFPVSSQNALSQEVNMNKWNIRAPEKSTASWIHANPILVDHSESQV